MISQLQAALMILWTAGVIAFVVLKKKKWNFLRKPKTVIPPRSGIIETTARQLSLEHENARLRRTLAQMKAEKIEKEIEREAKRRIEQLVPAEQRLISRNEIVGRPIYLLGGTPPLDIEAEVDRLTEESRIPLPETVKRRLLRRLYFGSHHTIHFWGARMLPNGRWAIVASSKPPKVKRGKFKLPRLTKTYLLPTSEQHTLDDLFLNRWEATHAGAALELAATFLGPLPLEKWVEITGGTI